MEYIDVTPIIPNTTMRKGIFNGVERFYEVSPVGGYVLHHSSRDWTDTNPETGEETFYRGYGRSGATVALTYDFNNTTEIDGYTAYGEKEIFAREVLTNVGICPYF